MKIKLLKIQAVVIGYFLVFIVGCKDEPSKEWQQASAEVAHEEYVLTNGMALPSNSPSQEIVLTPGMKLTFQTKIGEIKIRAGENFERFYTWDGETRSVKMWPRKTRWYGSRGIYYPGPGRHWKSNHGITRGVLEEGILWFKTVDDAMAYLNRWPDYFIYNNTGLVVGAQKVLAREQLNVDVWQIMIDGKKPQSLPGSPDDLITMEK